MIRKRKWIVVFFVFVFIAGVSGFFLLSGEEADSGEAAVVVGEGGFPASARDAKVYFEIETYLSAQVKNDRDKVLSMLSPEHRLEWKDESFLLTEQAFEMFDEIRLGDLKMGVIEFNEVQEKVRADVYLSYILYLVKDNKVNARVNMIEDLGLAETGEGWHIDRSVRTVVTQGE